MPLSRANCVPLNSLTHTAAFAEGVADEVLSAPPFQLAIALSGPLGSGKTQWVRYFCQALGIPAEEVTSPTYVLLQRHIGQRTVHHLDLYRLKSAAEVWDLGVDELLAAPHIVVIEWADRFPECIPEECLAIALEHGEGGRIATCRASGRPASLLQALVDHSAHRLDWSAE